MSKITDYYKRWSRFFCGLVGIILVGYVTLFIVCPWVALGLVAISIVCWWLALKYSSVTLPPDAPLYPDEFELDKNLKKGEQNEQQ